MRRFFAARSTASVMLLAVLFILAPFQPPVGVVGFVGSGGGAAEAAEPWDGVDVADAFSGGSGTSTDPYLISTAAELALLADKVNNDNANYGSKHYRLTADIDLGNQPWTPIGIGASVNNRFTGTFDGGGYTISNMLVSGDYMCAGLFGYALGTSVIKDTHLVDFTVSIDRGTLTVGASAGGLVGLNAGTITNCSASGSVAANSASSDASAGGLAGDNSGTITNCSASGSVVMTANGDFSSAHAGGLVGDNDGEISNCSASGNVTAYSTDRFAKAGGIAADNEGTILNCSASGSATAYSQNWDAYVGGLVGSNGGIAANIRNSSASGSAAAYSQNEIANAGGLVGYNTREISNSSASGSAMADSINSNASAGGLVGDSTGGAISNCFSSGGAMATGGSGSYEGGLAGINYGTVADCRWLSEGSVLDTVGVGDGSVDAATKGVSLTDLQALSRAQSWDIAAGWRLTSLDEDGGMHRTLFFTDDVQNVLSPDAVFTAPGSLALSGGEIKTLHLIPAYFHAEPITMSFNCSIAGVSIKQHDISPDIVIVSADVAAFGPASAEVTIEYEISGDVSDTPQTKSFELRTFSTLEIKNDILNEGRVYTSYSQTIETGGAKGTGTITITVSEDKLPAGVSFDGIATISGTPTVDGTFTFNVIAVDPAGQVAEKTLTLTIHDAYALLISDAAFDGDEIWLGEPFTATVSADGGVKPYAFSAPNTDKPLPPGLSIDTSGDISGTPTAEGDYRFDILVTDYVGKTHSRDFSLTVTDPNTLVDIGDRFPAPSASSTAVITPITTGTPALLGNAITQVMPISASIQPLAASAANISGYISLTDGLKIDIDLDAADGDVLFLNYEARLSMLAASLPELANWPNIDDEARVELLESLADSRGLALIYEYVTPENASVPHTTIIGKGGLLEWSEAITNGAVGMTSTGISFKYAVTDGPGKPSLDEASKFVLIPDGKADNRLRDPLWLAIETSNDPDDPHHSGSGAGCATGAGMIALLALGIALRRKQR